MARKKTKKKSNVMSKISSNVRDIYDEYKEKVLLLLATFLEEEARHIVHWVKDIAQIKQKIRKLAISMALTLTGIILLFIGVSDYAAYMIPQIGNGLSYAIVGVLLMLSAWIYSR